MTYTTYNSDGSVRSTQTTAQKKSSDAAAISSGRDTPVGVGGTIDETAVGGGTKGVGANGESTFTPAPPAGQVAPAQTAQSQPATQQTPPLPAQSAPPQSTASTQSSSSVSTPNAGQPNAPSDLSAQYHAAADTLNNSGGQSPSQSGAASTAIDQALKAGPQQAYTPAPEVVTQVDDAMSQYTQAVADYLNPDNQRQSLVDEYQQMSDKLGIQGLNAQLLDVNRIMDGTEDDIRSEVTAAGGFATESQVQAMTIGRNKSLLKKAQFVQDQLTAAKDQLGTMMNLSAQDRQFSEQRMQSGLSLLGNVVQIKQSMQKAANDNFNNIVQNAGYDGLLKMTGNDPYNIAMTEKTLGIAPGGLQALAMQSADERVKSQQKDELQLDALRSNLLTDSLQRENISDEIRSRNANDALAAQKANDNEYGTLNGKAQTVQQAQANGYADRMVQANKSLTSLDIKFSSATAIGGFLPNFLKSSDRQVYEQAQTNFVNAILRQESGAAISSGEFKSAKEQYFAQPGDSAKVLLQKQDNRNTAINNFYRQANIPRPVSAGDLITGDDGNNYKVGDDGETLIPIN